MHSDPFDPEKEQVFRLAKICGNFDGLALGEVSHFLSPV
jgi:hypothetical protein